MPSASSLFNMTRNLGGSVGIALLATALTNREHFHSARLGESVSLAATATQARLDAADPGLHRARASTRPPRPTRRSRAIDRIVRREAYVMAYNDGFFIVGAILLGGDRAAVVRGQGQVARRRRRRRPLITEYNG